MTFWLDAHLDPELAPWLGSRFRIFVKTLRDIGLRDAEDEELFAAARRFGQIVIVTKDSDFARMVERLGSPPQIVWLRCGNLSTIEMQAFFVRRFDDVLTRLHAGESLIEVAD